MSTIRELRKQVTRLNRQERADDDDEIMSASGCGGEFADASDRKRRDLVSQIFKQARRGSRTFGWAATELERWMP